ncbi:hypothetical protein [Massilia timonae]|uniref:hypothetical protein n=1 Tax=Massilia timonae TaxID=47229 RepID=UPI0028D4918D|nr:hypothetical protein [Massilia timonae]
MTRTFENPVNGHQETVSGGASVGVFFLGGLYLLFKGLWGHFLIWLLVVSIPIALVDGYTLIFTSPILAISYALTIQGILSTRYLQRGWREVSGNAGNAETATAMPVVSPTSPSIAPQQPTDAATKTCPYCAETIKAAAIRCKHCQADLNENKPSQVVS